MVWLFGHQGSDDRPNCMQMRAKLIQVNWIHLLNQIKDSLNRLHAALPPLSLAILIAIGHFPIVFIWPIANYELIKGNCCQIWQSSIVLCKFALINYCIFGFANWQLTMNAVCKWADRCQESRQKNPARGKGAVTIQWERQAPPPWQRPRDLASRDLAPRDLTLLMAYRCNYSNYY